MNTRFDELLRYEILVAAPRFGMHVQVAGDLAGAIVEGMRMRLGGKTQYISMRDRALRDDNIRAAFDGRNHEWIARQYGLSVRQVRRIVAVGRSASAKK